MLLEMMSTYTKAFFTFIVNGVDQDLVDNNEYITEESLDQTYTPFMITIIDIVISGITTTGQFIDSYLEIAASEMNDESAETHSIQNNQDQQIYENLFDLSTDYSEINCEVNYIYSNM